MDAKVKQALLLAIRNFWHRDDVTGIDIGRRIKRGSHKDELCVRFHVKEKKTKALLGPAARLPTRVDGIPTDVLAATYYPKGATGVPSLTLPAAAGGAVGDGPHSFGTLGAIVRDNLSSKLCGLTCGHVLAASIAGNADAGIFQPPPHFNIAGQRPIGRLGRFLWRDGMDAALIDFADDATVVATLPSGAALLGIAGATENTVLRKCGANTRQTDSVVEGVSGLYLVDYGDRQLSFRAIRLKPVPSGDAEISEGGDSGAVWYEPQSTMAIGLNFAGEETPFPEDEYALALPMHRVFSALNISLP